MTIIGAGGLGLSAVQGAKASGAGKIIVVDVHEEKLEMAKKFGATHTILNRKDVDEVVKEVMDITWGEGTDFSFEFVGWDQSPNTLDIAFQSVRKGGTMVFTGSADPAMKSIPVNPYHLQQWQKSIVGVLFGGAQFRTDIPRIVSMVESGQVNLKDMVTLQFPLEEINTAIENVHAKNKAARQVIRFHQ